MTIWKNVKKYKTEVSSLNLNKDRSDRKRTEPTQENINLLQEKLIEDSRISDRKNGLDLTESLNSIWNGILKNACKKRKKKLSWFTERKSGLTKMSYGRNAKKDASLSSKKWRSNRKKRKLAAHIRNRNILCFRIKYGNLYFFTTTFY